MTLRFGSELGLPLALQLTIAVVFQETGFVQSVEKVLFQFADLNLARDPHQFRPQVKRRLDAVEAFQSLYQRRRHEQRGIRIVVRIAYV